MAEHRYRRSGRHIAVIGAGWAGCAAAVSLAAQGQQVTLLEAARSIGGRARRVQAHGHTLDNGQHILLGAYSASLGLMRQVGVDTASALLRLPLQMVYPPADDGMCFIAPRLPAPLHVALALWRASGLRRADKMALARFSSTARWMGWQLHQDCSVAELLQRYDQTERLCRLMWHPLCIAALNTPPERASAQVFLNVLRDSLGAGRAASDMLLPRVDLSALLPQQAADYLHRHGGQLQTGSAVKALRHHMADGWQLHFQEHSQHAEQRFDAVILATDIANTRRLLASLPQPTTTLPEFSYEAITTCYLQYPATLRLARPMLALLDQPQLGKWGQYVFDRGQLDAAQAGLLAVVVSASQQACQLPHAALAQAVARQLAASLQLPELATPLWHQVISEKRATFSCAPGLARPANRTARSDLWLAGDYTAGDYPATLEGAVRSGVGAAKQLLQTWA